MIIGQVIEQVSKSLTSCIVRPVRRIYLWSLKLFEVAHQINMIFIILVNLNISVGQMSRSFTMFTCNLTNLSVMLYMDRKSLHWFKSEVQVVYLVWLMRPICLRGWSGVLVINFTWCSPINVTNLLQMLLVSMWR